jgi:hypothetical protein
MIAMDPPPRKKLMTIASNFSRFRDHMETNLGPAWAIVLGQSPDA